MKRTWKRVVKSMGAVCFVTICVIACAVGRNEMEGVPAKIEVQAAKKSDVLLGREKMIKSEMRKLVIGDKITSLGAFSFADCKALEEVHFGKKVSKISRSVFQGCTSLKKLNCTDHIKSIEMDACNGCESLEKIYFGKKFRYLNQGFDDCKKLKEVKISKKIRI